MVDILIPTFWRPSLVYLLMVSLDTALSGAFQLINSLVSEPLKDCVRFTQWCKYFTSHKHLSAGNAPNTISLWCWAGVEVFSSWHLTSSLDRVMLHKPIIQMAWPLWPETDKDNRMTFKVSCEKGRCLAGDHFFKTSDTTAASRVTLWRGRVGLRWNTSRKNFQPKGDCLLKHSLEAKAQTQRFGPGSANYSLCFH